MSADAPTPLGDCYWCGPVAGPFEEGRCPDCGSILEETSGGGDSV